MGHQILSPLNKVIIKICSCVLVVTKALDQQEVLKADRLGQINRYTTNSSCLTLSVSLKLN